MKNVYGYIRVSTKKQEKGASLEAQRDAIERYASQRDLRIVRWFEEKLTASKTGRPLFLEMMRLLRKKAADGAIIHKIDRSARNLRDWTDVTNIIEKYPDVDIYFAHEGVDLRTRAGRLSGDLQAAFAADFSRNQRQEVKKGQDARLKQGLYPWQAPVGYLDTGRGKVKAPDPVQAPLIRKAFELYSTRKFTFHQLLKHMHALGLRNTRGGRVTLTGLSTILNSTFYVGIIRVKGTAYEGIHEPLVTPELFKRVQAILRGNTNQRVMKHDFLFRKMLRCKGCGYSLIAESQKGHTYYRCHTRGCITKGIRESLVEGQLISRLKMTQLEPAEVEGLIEHLENTEFDWQTKQKEVLSSIKLQKTSLSQKLERLVDTYLEEGSGIDKVMFDRKKEKLLFELKEKDALEHALSAENGRIYVMVRKFLELAKSLTESYKNGILEEKRELLETVTSNLIVEGKKLIVTIRTPFLEMVEKHKVLFSDLNRDGHRTTGEDFGGLNGESLSKEKLKLLLDEIMGAVAGLPDPDDNTEYGI